ncbi:MAG: hypothetical protein CSA20_03185 [Deltaproteobacteria bacterium]|nr:MAG: hypothetical protein CSB23_02810 [Deltaproteobacteria bacterium]PIE73375.1 MAG: hypothetical protein CSA20_03185 [Deltaproteobacteria bacterium]
MMNQKKKMYWQLHDLVTIGVFAAVAKVSSVLVALVGGGMNPLTMVLKSLIFTTLLIVLLYKVRKFGTLILFVSVSAIISMLLMGGNPFLLISMLFSATMAEAFIAFTGGYTKSLQLIIGVGLYDLFYRGSALGLSWLYMREEAGLFIMAAIAVVIGYAGSLIGLFTGNLFVKELRHACIIRS